MSQQFDLIVIGTGPAGSTIAKKCSEQGWSVATIESTAYGGTCPNSGCIPKKIFSSQTELIDQIRLMQGSGIRSDSQINWQELIAFNQSFTEPTPATKEKDLQKNEVITFHGQASFVDQNCVQVNEHLLQGRKIVIATGAKPISLPIKGMEHLVHSDGFFELENLPPRIIFIGGGYISLEFAHIAARAGSDVQIIEGEDHVLSQFDSQLVDLLVQKSQEIGIKIALNTKVKAIEKTDKSYHVIGDSNGDHISWESDLVIHGAGRAPNVEQLNLEKGNVANEKGGISVNQYLQSVSNPNVYAAGDVADTEGPPLTPVAGIEAKAVSENLMNGNQQKLSYNAIPSVVFTSPKIAMVGMTEEEAKQSDDHVNIKYSDISKWFTYQHTNQTYAGAKIMTNKRTGQILGAHILSNEADALINFFALAIELKLSIRDLKKITYAFPTAIADIPSML